MAQIIDFLKEQKARDPDNVTDIDVGEALLDEWEQHPHWEIADLAFHFSMDSSAVEAAIDLALKTWR